MIPPRDFAKLSLFYCQELVLDAATPGQDAKERLIRNAKLLRDSCEAMVTYWGWTPKELLAEVWKDHPEALKRENNKKACKKK